MQMNRGLIFWGVALVTAGIVALAVQQGYIDESVLAGAWRLWPLILVAIGLSIILSRTPFAVLGTIAAAVVLGVAGGALITVGPGFAACGGGEPTSTTTEEGTFGGAAASVELEFNCGSLHVRMTDGDGWSVEAGQRGDETAEIVADASSLTVRSGDRSFLDGGEQRWDVALGAEPTYSLLVGVNAADSDLDLAGGTFSVLTIDPNAGSVVVDLAGASVDELDISLNAGSVSVTVDADSNVAGSLGVNAGSIDLCTAPGTALRVVVEDNLTFSHNLEDSDLNASGDTFMTDGFADADQRIDLHLEGNAGSFTLNPEDGCS